MVPSEAATGAVTSPSTMFGVFSAVSAFVTRTWA
jgi:hypothetical protein